MVAAVLALCGTGYYVLCLWSAHSFRRDCRRPVPEFAPPVSILKPLRGVDPQMYESFRSHCLQDYPAYEIIFGVNEPDDPAAEAVYRLAAEFPACNIRLVLCPEILGNNRKASNLVQMLPHAVHGHILINDSDIFVPRDYLRRVMGHFERPGVGMVTSLYKGIAAGTLGSKLESLGISTDFFAGVLAARQVEKGIHFALGSTLAINAEALKKIGGMAPLVDYLADDYEMGKRTSNAGMEVVMSDLVVETHLPPYSLRHFLDHQMRWARSTRDSRRAGYLGMALTFGLPWAIVSVLLSAGAWWSWSVLGCASLLRMILALVVGVGLLRDETVLRRLWLLPLRDLVALGVWFGSYAGHEVHWRGEVFLLENGKIKQA